MKFLATILFFFLYGLAPVHASVKVVYANKIAPFVKTKTAAKETIKCTAASNGLEVINTSNQTSVSVHPHYEISKYFNNNQSSVQKLVCLKLKLINVDGFCCEPIGLRLIFPEHYFF